jgi:hypothetical protein
LSESKIENVGENYLYSNFGYCILGRVIEKITGISYINYIKDLFKVKVAIAGNTLDKI